MATLGVWRSAIFIGLALGLTACATATAPPPPELVWPIPPDTPRIRYVESFATSLDLGKKTSWLEDVVLGPNANRPQRMMRPLSVTTDAKGTIYVTDTGTARVWAFDRVKREVRYLGGSAGLAGPAGVAVDGRGRVFVSDSELKKVFAFDDAGKVVLTIGARDEFTSPAGLAIDRASNRLYVADTRGHKIRVYNTETGELQFEMAKRGSAPGEFNFPTNLYIRNRVLYVADTGNFRVQALTLDGKFLRKYGELGANLGQLARPKGVAADSEGHVYVVDAAFGNFQIYDQESDLLLFVGSNGSDRGQFRLPAGMFIDDADRIYVVDQYNARVQVFQYLGKDVELAKSAKRSDTR